MDDIDIELDNMIYTEQLKKTLNNLVRGHIFERAIEAERKALLWRKPQYFLQEWRLSSKKLDLLETAERHCLEALECYEAGDLQWGNFFTAMASKVASDYNL